VREYALEVYDAAGQPVSTDTVRIKDHPGRTELRRLASRQIQGAGGNAGILKADGRVQALFLDETLLPDNAIGISGASLDRGAWFTATAPIAPALRGLLGPDAFTRQADLSHPWLALHLMRFETSAPVRRLALTGGDVFELGFNKTRFFYTVSRTGWVLYGAGSVERDAVDHALATGAQSPTDLFWAIGAIKLG